MGYYPVISFHFLLIITLYIKQENHFYIVSLWRQPKKNIKDVWAGVYLEKKNLLRNFCFLYSGVPFPKNFLSIAKTILKRLFRVYAHIYHQHFKEVVQLSEEAHLNTSFKHFIYFVQEFNLIERRELAPLQELIDKLTSKDR